jgi:hypothetical protein
MVDSRYLFTVSQDDYKPKVEEDDLLEPEDEKPLQKKVKVEVCYILV